MQTLYEYDFRVGIDESVDLAEILGRNLGEFSDSIDDTQFVHDVVNGTLAHQEDIDKIIGPAAPEWPVARTGRTSCRSPAR